MLIYMKFCVTMNRVKNIMKLFNINSKETSYKKVILRLVIFLFLLAFFYFLRDYLKQNYTDYDHSFIKLIMNLINGFCAFGVLLSLFGFIHVNDNKSHVAYKNGTKKTKWDPATLPTERIIDILNNEDIIELYIKVNNKAFLIGTSSDYDNRKNIYFAKEFQIDNQSFLTINELLNHILIDTVSLAKLPEVCVLSIDDMNPTSYKI